MGIKEIKLPFSLYLEDFVMKRYLDRTKSLLMKVMLFSGMETLRYLMLFI